MTGILTKPHGISSGIRWCEEKPVYKKVLTYKYVQNSTQRLPLDSIEYRCRFCGKVKTKQDFQHKAHAVAECIGNKSLITKYECDACNTSFANAEENELGKLLLEFKATHSLKGKNGITKIQGAEYSWSEEKKTFSAKINMREAGYDIAAINVIDNSKAEFLICRNKEVDLRLVYSALVKFALSVVSETISKELNKGYEILHGRDVFPSYKGWIAISQKPIADPEISIYESDNSAGVKYLGAIDAFQFRYIIPLEFEKAPKLSLLDIMPYIDISGIDDCRVYSFDYSSSQNLPQITQLAGNLNNWSIGK